MRFLTDLFNFVGLLFILVGAALLRYYEPRTAGLTTPADLEHHRETDQILDALIAYRFAVLFLGIGLQLVAAFLRVLA